MTPTPDTSSFRGGAARAETTAVRSGLETDLHHGAVVAPLHLSSTYTFAGFDQKRTYDYTRSGNPTRDTLAHALAELEGGSSCQVTSSGMSAITLTVQLLDPGDTLVAPLDCYGGTYRLFRNLADRGLFRVEFVDLRDTHAVDRALAEHGAMLWVETPSNPLLRLCDIRQLADLAHAHGARLVVDNTFLSPALQRPIELGADLVVHSTTKYLNGHSDVVGGAVIAATPEDGALVAEWANTLGLTGSPFDSYLTLRGVRTLHARLRLHEENALRVVETLESHPAVAETIHPSLSDHPEHELALRQQDGFGAMVSFRLRGGRHAVATLVENLRHFSLAESLGGVESLIAHPATMTHASMDAPARERAGICDSLLRLSVGIEDPDDLCRDLQRALDLAAEAEALALGPGAQPLAGVVATPACAP